MPTPFLKPISPVDRQRLGKYDLLCRLTTGGMSELFLAAQRGLAGFRKIVVLKSILPDIKGEETFVQMFLQEARITASFSHPNIAQVFDLDTDDGTLFLVMEFVQGATLDEVTRGCEALGERVPLGFTLTAIRDTALALHYAHSFCDARGRPLLVIHRDVSGKNVMIGYEGTTKLLDFGIAKSLGRAGGARTSVGTVKGTIGYMSPEQALGEPLDPRTDVFSLGIVLHEGLAGRRLYARETAAEEMRALQSDVGPPSASNPAVSAALDRVTAKALARNRDQRYATALEFARALEAAAGGALWRAEQMGALVQRLYAERLGQTQRLIKQAQGATGEHSGIHRDELSTDLSSALGKGSERATAEHPIVLKVSAARAAPFEFDEDEKTKPAGLEAAPKETTRSMRAPSLPPTAPDALSSLPPLAGLPAFRPDGDIHDTGSRPIAPSKPAPLDGLFSDLPFDETTGAGHREPATVIASPRSPRARLLVPLGVTAAVGVAVGVAFGLLRTTGPTAPAPAPPPVAKPAPVAAPPPPAPVEPPAPSEPAVPVVAAEPSPAPQPPKPKPAKKGSTKKPGKRRPAK